MIDRLSGAPVGRPIGPGQPQADAYWRRAQSHGEHDGDTIYIEVDLGFGCAFRHKLRLSHCNAPEIGSLGGDRAARFTAAWIAQRSLAVPPSANPPEWPFMVRFDHWDNYGERFDGVLIDADGACLNDDLITSGNAVYR